MSLKILHLIDSGGLYGAENMLLDLVTEQLRQGLQPLILSAGTPGVGEKPLERAARERGLPLQTLRMKAGINLPAALRVMKFAKSEGFQVLHSHGYKFNILLGLLPRSMRAGVFVTTLHGYVSAGRASRLRLYRVLEHYLLRRLDGAVFVSDALTRHPLLRGIGVRRSATIHNGVNVQEIVRLSRDTSLPALQDIVPDRDHAVVIGALGRLSAEKGFELLLEVFARLVQRHAGLRLVILGEGGLRPALEQRIAELGLVDKVKLPGFVSPVHRIVRELDGIVMPSLAEGLPMTLLEACALQKRIVATRVGGIPELMESCVAGRLVEPGDPDALEQAMEALFFEQDDAGVTAMPALESRFSSAAMADAYTVFYRQVLEDARG
jgi:glycosyltransferase involved in cell wall biosynthesis